MLSASEGASRSEKTPPRQRQVVEMALQLLADRLPSQWRVLPVEPSLLPSDGRVDAVARLVAPDGPTALLLLEVKNVLERRDVPLVADQLRDYAQYVPNAFPVVLSRYITPSAREGLTQQQVSYIDATGNMRLSLTVPAVFVADRGADRDPWRSAGRPRGTLKGAPATRVVRTLLDFDRRWPIRDLVAESGASTGATYRVLEYLEQEDLIRRGEDRRYQVVDWIRLLRTWSSDYGLTQSNRVSTFINPRGLGDVLAQAAKSDDLTYAFSGTIAAERWAPYAPARSAVVYVEDVDVAAERWRLRPTETGVNVQLAVPDTDMPFRRTIEGPSGVRIVAVAQAAADLITGPGRNPAEAEELIEWMERNEPSWRRRDSADSGPSSTP